MRPPPTPHLDDRELTLLPARQPGRRPVHPEITEPLIEALVRSFYARVRTDAELGPIFATAITDWEPHLRRKMDFWSSVTRMTGRFHGQPVQKHMAIPGIGPQHFDRWLRLFGEAAQNVAPPDIAAIFIERATRIADSLLRPILAAQAAAASTAETELASATHTASGQPPHRTQREYLQ